MLEITEFQKSKRHIAACCMRKETWQKLVNWKKSIKSTVYRFL